MRGFDDLFVPPNKLKDRKPKCATAGCDNPVERKGYYCMSCVDAFNKESA